MTDAEKRAKKKFNSTIKNLSIQIKKNSDDYIYIDDIVNSSDISYSSAVKAMISYCSIHHIDISAYIKEK